MLTLMAANTKKMKLGPCVTNPAVRDMTVTASLFATLNLISGGRMQLGIGRGDSSRRVLGKKPVGAGDLERAIKTLRELMSGKEVEYDGQPDAADLGDRFRRRYGSRATGRRFSTWRDALAMESFCSLPIRI